MKRNVSIFMTFSCFLVLLFSYQNCNQFSPVHHGNSSLGGENNFDSEKLSLALDSLNRNCVSCHGSTPPQNLDDITSMINKGLIIPGDSSSPIWDSIDSGRMPKGISMSQVDKDVILDFILNGIQATPTPVDNSPEEPPKEPEGEFPATQYGWVDIESILNRDCVRCHRSATNSALQPALESYNEVLKEVSPGIPDGSRLYDSIKSNRMPKSSNKLSDSQKEIIKNWIEGGAPFEPTM